MNQGHYLSNEFQRKTLLSSVVPESCAQHSCRNRDHIQLGGVYSCSFFKFLDLNTPPEHPLSGLGQAEAPPELSEVWFPALPSPSSLRPP